MIKLNKELAKLTPLVDSFSELQKARLEIAALHDVLRASAHDPEMLQLAQEELAETQLGLPAAAEALALMLVPEDEADERDAILEVRAGAGGDEASLFAGDLLRMCVRLLSSTISL